MCLSSLFILFLFSYILYVIETMLNIPYAYLAKVQQQNEYKKNPGVSEYGPWMCNWAN